MIIRNIDREFQINTDFLNSLNFIPFLKNYQRLGQMMCAIEKTFNDIPMPSELEYKVFNYYSEDDFKDYLLNRYPTIKFYPIEDYLIDYREGE